MQTILGSGGAIGIELAKSLPKYTDKIRLVSRNPKKVNLTDELFKADLTVRKQVLEAVKGSSIVYLTVGLSYDLNVWENYWPKLMRNVIHACQVHEASLVFFDNIYMYEGIILDPITEENTWNPPSNKGKVRANIARLLLDAHKKGKIKGLIARSADFYGPSVKNTSVLVETVFKPLSQGKKASWIGNPHCKHSYTYTPDAAKATALLGNTPDAYGEVWHLPTAHNPYTGKEWIKKVSEALHVKPKYRSVNKFGLKIMGLFVPVMKEFVEMIYQNDRDYVFDSQKFENKFNFQPTSYEDGIKAIVASDFSK